MGLRIPLVKLAVPGYLALLTGSYLSHIMILAAPSGAVLGFCYEKGKRGQH